MRTRGWGSVIAAAALSFACGSGKDSRSAAKRQYQIALTVTGPGAVVLSTGDQCRDRCMIAVTDGTHVTATAAPDSGAQLSGWSNACAGAGACDVTVVSDLALSATFSPVPPPPVRLYQLTISTKGLGSVISTPAGIDCGATCSASFASARQIALAATAAAGWRFDSWDGACQGSGSCAVGLAADTAVSATFVQSPPPPPPPVLRKLTLIFTGAGKGRVGSSAAALDCRAACSATVTEGTTVALVAAAEAGSTFAGWGGACTGQGACSVTATADATVQVDFEASPPPPPPDSCAGIAAPDPVAMQQWVHAEFPGSCGPGYGDGNGTLAFLHRHQAYALGIQYEALAFVTTANKFLQELEAAPGRGFIRVFEQPVGLLAGINSGSPFNAWSVGAWDSSGDRAGPDQPFRGERGLAVAADPGGGLLFAGLLSYTGTLADNNCEGCTRSGVMYNTSGHGVPTVRWGPAALDSKGNVLGAGVGTSSRSLVITDGASRFGAGNFSAQWFDRDGTSLTGEFILLSSSVPKDQITFETSPLIGGGLLVQSITFDGPPTYQRRVRPLVVVGSGATTVRLAPEWITSRSAARLKLARGGRAYAVLPNGAKGASCSQSVEVLAADGTSCGKSEYPIAPGTCDTGDVTSGADGTVIQPLPFSMETQREVSVGLVHTCTWRWWPGALR